LKENAMGSFVELQSADGFRFPAYVAHPTGKPRAGLVVLQEIFGVNAHIREVADGYGAEGYLVVAPATFHRTQAGVDLGYTQEDMTAGFGYKTAIEALPAPGVLRDIQAAIGHAAQAGKVGITGYCWGGLLSLAVGLSGVRPQRSGAVLRRRHDQCRGIRSHADRAGHGPFWRPGPLDSDGHGGSFPRRAPRGDGPCVSGQPRVQLRPPRFV
jgi:hypothetical protein